MRIVTPWESVNADWGFVLFCFVLSYPRELVGQHLPAHHSSPSSLHRRGMRNNGKNDMTPAARTGERRGREAHTTRSFLRPEEALLNQWLAHTLVSHTHTGDLSACPSWLQRRRSHSWHGDQAQRVASGAAAVTGSISPESKPSICCELSLADAFLALGIQEGGNRNQGGRCVLPVPAPATGFPSETCI